MLKRRIRRRGGLPCHHATPDSVEFDAGFVENVRCMLEELIQHAIDSFEQPKQWKDGKSALAGSWRKICSAISTDFVTQVLVSAVPLPVQDIILQPEWDTSEIFNLEVVEQEDGPLIVYGNFCQKGTSYTVEHECYTDFT